MTPGHSAVKAERQGESRAESNAQSVSFSITRPEQRVGHEHKLHVLLEEELPPRIRTADHDAQAQRVPLQQFNSKAVKYASSEGR